MCRRRHLITPDTSRCMQYSSFTSTEGVPIECYSKVYVLISNSSRNQTLQFCVTVSQVNT